MTGNGLFFEKLPGGRGPKRIGGRKDFQKEAAGGLKIQAADRSQVRK
jgi:hypothetical protein